MTSASHLTSTSAAGEMRGLSPATAYYAQVRVISATGTAINVLLRRCEGNHRGRCRVAGNCQTTFSGVLQRALLHLQRWNARGNAVGQPPRRGGSDHHFQDAGHHRRSGGLSDLMDNRPGGYTQFEDLRDRLNAAGGVYKLSDTDRNNCVDSKLPTNCVYAEKAPRPGRRSFTTPTLLN